MKTNQTQLKTRIMKQLYKIQTIFLVGIFATICNFSIGQSLDSLLQLVVENNPTLKALELDYEAEALKADQVSQLPNLELGSGIPVLRPETRLGGQVVMVSASQMFPWFGTLRSKKDVVIAMSKARYEMVAAKRLDLFNKVKQAYYQLYFLQEKENIINEYIEIYKTIESVALAKVESGQSTTADVLRIQLKLQELRQELKIIDSDRRAYSSRINELANLSWGTIIRPTDQLNEIATMEYDFAKFKAQIEENHPLNKKIAQQIEASKLAQQSNRNMNRPSFGLGIDYSMVQPRTDANPSGNGQDILIPKVKISIPLYRKSYRAKNEQEEKIQESLNYQKIDITNRMLAILQQEKSNYDNAILENELYQQQIATTQMAYEILLSQYSSTGKGFDELLQVQNQLINYQLKLAMAQLKSYKAKANIERITEY